MFQKQTFLKMDLIMTNILVCSQIITKIPFFLNSIDGFSPKNLQKNIIIFK